jgi:hypothetical protein
MVGMWFAGKEAVSKEIGKINPTESMPETK